VAKSPKRIRVRDSDALLEHAKVLEFRSRCHDLIDQELQPAEQRVEEARLKLREAELAVEQVKLALEAIGLEELHPGLTADGAGERHGVECAAT